MSVWQCSRSLGATLTLLLWLPPSPAASAVYTFHTKADALLEVFFSPQVRAEGMCHAYAWRLAPSAPRDIEEVLEKNISSAHIADPANLTIDFGQHPIESYWLSIASSTARATELLERARQVALASTLEHVACNPFAIVNPLEKSLFQRDVFQAFEVTRTATNMAQGDLREYGELLQHHLGDIFRRTLLSEAELGDVAALLPASLDGAGFQSASAFSAAYLPRVVLDSTDWNRIPFGSQASHHFQTFGGRSFIEVYARAPDLTEEQVRTLWTDLWSTYGPRLHLHGGTPPVPAGFETVLVRRPAVFLQDNTVAPGPFPEEVLIRAFKYPEQRMDASTTDYRGTSIHQLKLDRKRLLRNPQSLGLRSIPPDAPQFYGFYAEAPDPRNGYSDTISTMRYNCIGCHSEAFYGFATVFSFEHAPTATDNPVGRIKGGLLERSAPTERFRLRSESLSSILTLPSRCPLPRSEE